jgi:anti-sigma regulatory factor (Ser/Thr protein kinase)
VRNASSLLGATQGLAQEQAGNLDLYLRSSAEMLPRLRSVVAAVASEARLTGAAQSQLASAVNEAATNAIVHGSPEGPRNHVRVTFHVDRTTLIVEVADQGGGFDPARVPVPRPDELRENGYGLHMMRQFMDRVEFFRDDAGMLVRMTKYLSD